MAASILQLALLALVSGIVFASDPSPLQDFCIADPTSKVFVNGLVCKNSKDAQANDFFFSGLDKVGNTSNQQGAIRTLITAATIPGLNTLGISLARLDFAPYGLLAPHYHPRATELMTVIQGSLYVGFVTAFPENRLISKVVNAGEVFVFPKGHVHFQYNNGLKPAVAISGLSSQNPGLVVVGNAVFGSSPRIWDEVIAKAFQLDTKTVGIIQARF